MEGEEDMPRQEASRLSPGGSHQSDDQEVNEPVDRNSMSFKGGAFASIV